MSEAMSPVEFKHGINRLADDWMERVHAMQIWSAYIDASDNTKRDLSEMLREDLEALDQQEEG